MESIHDHDHSLYIEGKTINTKRESRLTIALALNMLIVISQIIFGFIAHSLGLLADAGHNLTDVGAIALSLIAIKLVKKQPTVNRSFGFHRASILAAQANAAMILIVTGIITFESIRRIINPEPVRGGILIIVAGIAAVINLASALLVHEKNAEHRHDLNMKSAMLHLVADGLASIAVVIAGAVILLTDGFYWLDPALSLAIGLLIAYQGSKLLLEANNVLLESTPSGIDPIEVTKEVITIDKVAALHDLHIWSLSNDIHALSAHVVLLGEPSLQDAQKIGTKIKNVLESKFSISHATLEYENENYFHEGRDCAID